MKAETRRQIDSLRHAQDPRLTGHLRACATMPTKSSRYRGVYWSKRNEKWAAQIKEPGKKWQTKLGLFATEEAAAKAYDLAARDIWGDAAFQNLPATPDD